MNSYLKAEIENLLQQHIDLMLTDVELFSNEMVEYIPPYPEPSLMMSIAEHASIAFARDPVLLDLKPPITVVGDIHGHILDLYRILRNNALPPLGRYLFLGDIVDRGVYSTECITLIFILKILYPKNVFVIRGNHEFLQTQSPNKLSAEIKLLYQDNDHLVKLVYAAFSYIPIAARIGSIICVHGGIDPSVNELSDILSIKRPLNVCVGKAEGIVWGDPSLNIKLGYAPSKRGAGFIFSEDIFKGFLKRNKLALMIRGHSYVKNGVEIIFNGKCITVFSASNYVPEEENEAAIIKISKDYQLDIQYFPPLKTPKRIIMTPIFKVQSLTEQLFPSKLPPLNYFGKRNDSSFFKLFKRKRKSSILK